MHSLWFNYALDIFMHGAQLVFSYVDIIGSLTKLLTCLLDGHVGFNEVCDVLLDD